MTVGDHRQLPRAGQDGPDALPRLGEQAALDENIILPARQGHGEGFHGVPPLEAVWATSRTSVRPMSQSRETW